MKIYKISQTNEFKKDLKQCIKRGKNLKKLYAVLDMLSHNITLPPKYKDHKLTGYESNRNVRDCHIEPDWVLIYEKIDDKLILCLLQIGTHSDLFR